MSSRTIAGMLDCASTSATDQQGRVFTLMPAGMCATISAPSGSGSLTPIA
jgi:uncharacterized membrane protein